MSKNKEYKDPVFKVAIGGRGGVGKTTICKKAVGKLSDKDFGNYKMTIGVDFYSMPKETVKGNIILLVWDLAGQDHFGPIIEGFLIGSNGLILAYDSTSMESYIALHKTWIPMVKKTCEATVPIILVSTKNDLMESQEVDPLVCKEFIESNDSSELNIVQFLEVSAKTGIGIQDIFNSLADHVIGKTDI